MCGFMGIVSKNKFTIEQIDRFGKLAVPISVRGPDSEGEYVNESQKIWLKHFRLSIIGTPEQGKQPSVKNDSTTSLVFNGEIYNYKKLSDDFLEETSYSDTAALHKLLDSDDVFSVLDATDGPYAIGYTNEEKNKLILARDRFGEKPLYVSYLESYVVFGSHQCEVANVSSFLRHDKVSLNNIAIKSFLSLGMIASPLSIFNNVEKLLPGQILTIDISNNSYFGNVSSIKIPIKNKKNIYKENEFDNIFHSSISNRFVADTDVSIYLSGGIDSSCVALGAKVQGIDFETFTLGFPGSSFDESIEASRFAKKLKVKHNVVNSSPDALVDFFLQQSSVSDFPIADSSTLPLGLLCSNVSNHFKVAISGDGGDELFYGYNKYIYARFLQNNYLFSFICRTLPQIPGGLVTLTRLLNLTGISKTNTINKLEKMISLASNKSLHANYFSTISKDSFLLSDSDALDIFNKLNKVVNDKGSHLSSWLRDMDINVLLPESLLVKSDSASMSCGMELRSPFLNKDLKFFSDDSGPQRNLEKLNGKHVLKRYIGRHIPAYNFMPKKGFGAPLTLMKVRIENELDRSLMDNTLTFIREFDEEFYNRLLQSLLKDTNWLLSFRLHSLSIWLNKKGFL